MGSGLLDVGDRVAGFAVEAFIARGGMAVVYRAKDLRLSRTVAVKVMAPELASDAAFRHRFTRECELAAAIDHPNIIPIYAAGEQDGLLYLVMRYVPGDHLGAVLKQRHRLDPIDVLAVFGQVAGALDVAHAHGLVHRDVKPANILLAGDGEPGERHVYLSDFGLTTRISADGETTTATDASVLGTLKYVAPERITGSISDHRADIYSFGCVLYEALAGQAPFSRQEEAAWVFAHVNEPPPPLTRFRPELPAAVDPVLARALAKDPDDRYGDCRTLMAELATALGQWDDPTVPLPTLDPAARPGAGSVGSVGSAGSAGSAASAPPAEALTEVGVRRSGPLAGPIAGSVGPVVGGMAPVPVAPVPAPAPAPAATPARRAASRRLPVLIAVLAVLIVGTIALVAGWPRMNSGASPGTNPGGSPGSGDGPAPATVLPKAAAPLDGETFVWRHFDDDQWKIETTGIDDPAGRLLLTARENRAVLLSPDRRTILYLRELAGVVTLRAVSADGGPDTPLFSDRTPTCPRLGRPALRADDTLVAVCYERPNGVGKLNVMTLDGRVLRTLDEGRIGDPTVSADGSRVVYWRASGPDATGGRLRIVDADGGDPRTLIDAEDGELADPAWSPTSNTLAYRRAVGDERQLLAVTVTGDEAGKPRRLTSRAVDQGPSWSPDGRRIAFRRGDDESSRLLVMAADGSDERVIRTNEGYSAGPVWSAR